MIVFGKSNGAGNKRIKYLRKKGMKIRSGLSTGNSKIGKAVIKTCADLKELSISMRSVLDEAIKGEM